MIADIVIDVTGKPAGIDEDRPQNNPSSPDSPSKGMTTMNEFMMALLQQTALQLNTQALANHQTTQHLADLAWLDKLTSMDIAESFATQGLQHASVGRDAVAGTIAGGGYPANARAGQAS